MTDLEFDVLECLYFVTPYQKVKEDVELSDEELVPVLKQLWDKGWLRCMEEKDVDLGQHDINLSENFNNYYYLATKNGLLAHNGME